MRREPFERWRCFREDGKGGTAVVFALSVVPMCGAVGLCIDLGRAYHARTSLQQITDSAALAGAIDYKTNKNATNAQTVAQSVFDAGAGSKFAGATRTATLNTSTKTMTVTSSIDVPTSFIQIVAPGRSSMTVGATAEALVQSDNLATDIEVSVMLDVTTSMKDSSGTTGMTKLQAMQSAATTLVNTIVQTSQTPHTSRVALVPFSAAVNVGSTYFKTVTGSNPTGSWTSVVERAGAYNATEDPPTSSLFPSYRLKHGSAKSPSSFIASIEKNRTSNTPSAAIITPLTSTKSTLTTAIGNYTADGTTAGHIGIGWAWYMLSPGWKTIWTGSSAPADYGKTVTKVAVLMSDFDFNVYYQNGVGDMNAQASALCTAMKTAGVTIYTVGFQVDATKSDAVSLFNTCASDASKAISATNGAQLISAFQTVADSVIADASTGIRLAK